MAPEGDSVTVFDSEPVLKAPGVFLYRYKLLVEMFPCELRRGSCRVRWGYSSRGADPGRFVVFFMLHYLPTLIGGRGVGRSSQWFRRGKVFDRGQVWIFGVERG